MKLHLEERVALVTGATGGIGLEISKALLEEGALLAACYRGSEEKLSPLYEWMDQSDIEREKVLAVEVDLCDTSQIDRAVGQTIEFFDRLDILINNAGYTPEMPFVAISDEERLKIMDINFLAPTQLMKRTMKQMMRQKGGVVVNVTSVVGDRLGRGVAIYASAKAALNRLTQVLAIEMGKKGIRVNTVAPGIIETPMSRPILNRLSRTQSLPIPLNRYGQPEEVAKAVIFLASDVSSYVTGHVLTVDGGMSL